MSSLARSRLTCVLTVASLRYAYDAAYHHAVSISAAGELASHVPQALWTVLDVVEAAVRSGRSTEANAHLHALKNLRIGEISSRPALVTVAATAMCASPTDPDLFEFALQVRDADQWPFEHAVSSSSTENTFVERRPPGKPASTSPPRCTPFNVSAAKPGPPVPGPNCAQPE